MAVVSVGRFNDHACHEKGNPMDIKRRQLLALAGAAVVVPTVAAQGGPKLTQILRSDLNDQSEKVQETVVNILEMGPGAAAPWHMHPGAQELLFVYEGDIVLEIHGQGTKIIKAGSIGIIPAEIPHLARNESARIGAKALVTHSRAEKDKPLTVVVPR
jgi:quercetin dioxygenase-like cupin family protein